MHEEGKDKEDSNNAINSDFNILELGKNLVKTSIKKIEEKNLIILGDKSSGKTSLFNNILLNFTQKETYTPTCGINYSFIRYQPNSNKKLIMNVYEIGGGISNVNLVKTILNEKNFNLKNSIFVINLDFSRPSTILLSLREYLKQLLSILKEVYNSENLIEIIENKNIKFRDKKENNNISNIISIFPAEIIVIGNKYDFLEKIDIEKIKWTCRCLRFFCFINAISLVYFKSGDNKLSKIFNNLITNIAFNLNNDNSNNFSQKNDILPLYILYGSDSLQEIGDPKVIAKGKDMTTLWEDTFQTIFDKEKEKDNFQFEHEKSLITEINNFDDNLKEKYKESRIDEELVIFE
jgi:GTPase SAR1 family protein